MRLKAGVLFGVCIVVAVIWFGRGEKSLNSESVKEDVARSKAFAVQVTRGVFENVEPALEAVGSFFPEDEVTAAAESFQAGPNGTG